MEKEISTTIKHNKELREKLKKTIIERKTFEKLLPILKIIDFENVAYTYAYKNSDKDKDYIRVDEDIICNEILGLCNVRTVVDNQDYTKDFYDLYNK